MNRVPRASFSIGILMDEDYRVLMGLKGGLETFGIFASLVIVGRERLQQGKARQLSETESLIFDNSLTHVLEMARITRKKFDAAISVLSEVAKETGGKPWVSLDRSGHIVIRSFFKFNASANWGGTRPGSGRPPSENQDDPENNHLDSKLESTRCASVSVSDSVSDSIPTPTPPEGECAPMISIQAKPPEPEPEPESVPTKTFHPEEDVRAIAQLADELFPTRDFGLKVFQVEASVDLEILEASLHDAKAAKKWDWDYIAGIHRKRCADGRMAKMTRSENRSVLKRAYVDNRVDLSAFLKRENAAQEALLAAERRAAR